MGTKNNRIVNFYIDLDKKDQVELEKLLSTAGFYFYDATFFDPYTNGAKTFNTLDEIEADLECK